MVIVDADTILDSQYSRELMRFAPLEDKAVQSYDGMSNEFENWLTRLAGLLTRSRYGIAMPLKVHAGLNVPLTGDGTVLGTTLLRREPWRVETITEGWELSAALFSTGALQPALYAALALRSHPGTRRYSERPPPTPPAMQCGVGWSACGPPSSQDVVPGRGRPVMSRSWIRAL
ncbi:MAG: hypothetical protein IPK12_15045 [Gemmatimonadetes bacterium]|nr:hypothetical protein [Gemmatimonadota bacterium]